MSVNSIKAITTAVPTLGARPYLSQRGITREILETVVLIIAIYALVNLMTARFVVDGESMKPNFATGQFLIVSRVSYLFSEPVRGDIVVFHYPNNTDEDYIKRVIGVPGDTVHLLDGDTYVNGELLEEPYILEPCTRRCADREWELGETEYFVMGDNRNNSSDSRAFGPVDRQFLVGEALLRYWPPQDWGVVESIRFAD